MALNRVCLALLLVVSLHSVAGKPFFGEWICDWLCSEYGDDDDTTSDTSAWDFDFGCDDCTTQSATTTMAPTTAATTIPVIPGPNPSELTIEIPSGSAPYIVTLTQNDNKWGLIMAPKPDAGGQATAGTTTTGTTTVVTTTTAETTAAAGTTAAGASTADPDATTAAATTAAK